MGRAVWAVPVGLLAVAVLCVAAGAALVWSSSSTSAHLVGWALSSVVAIICVALLRRQLSLVANRKGVVAPAKLHGAALVVLLAGWGFGVANAVLFAKAVARWPTWSA